MHLPDPTFPPLLSGHGVSAPDNPMAAALSAVTARRAGAGKIFWARNVNRMQFALVLEPEVPRARCGEMLYLGMVAFSDAFGAIAPPEVAVTFLWPQTILVNGAIAGRVDLHISEQETENIPDWMVFAMDVDIRPDNNGQEAGERLAYTCLHLEGCGEIDRTGLMESVARHMVNWIYTWGEDGFEPIHKEWIGRHHDDSMGMLDDQIRRFELFDGDWLSMDEMGNALVKHNGETRLIATCEALSRAREEL